MTDPALTIFCSAPQALLLALLKTIDDPALQQLLASGVPIERLELTTYRSDGHAAQGDDLGLKAVGFTSPATGRWTDAIVPPARARALAYEARILAEHEAKRARRAQRRQQRAPAYVAPEQASAGGAR